MKKRIVLFVLLIAVVTGTAFSQSGLTQAERDLVADQINNAVSQINGLDAIISHFASVIPVLETYQNVADMKSILAMFEAAKIYKNATGTFDKERARFKLLDANLDLLNFAGKGMGAVQGMILPLVIQGVQNTVKIIEVRNAREGFNASAVSSAAYTKGYEHLSKPQWDKYKPIGWRMLEYGDKDADGATWERIEYVFNTLAAIENSSNYRGTTNNPVKYFIGEKAGGGTVFLVNSSGAFVCTNNRGNFDWNEALAYERDIKSGKQPMGGKTDWRLPTPDELNAMYRNKQQLSTLNWYNESYWAKNGNSPVLQNFANGGANASPDTSLKRHVVFVRKL